MNSADINVLNELYRNADMGASSIRQVISRTRNTPLKKELISQLSTYVGEKRDITNRLAPTGVKKKTVSPMTRAMADMGIAMSAAVDNSDSHIAEMMLRGTNMGVINITKVLNHSGNISHEVKSTADKMLENEQVYISKLKEYL